MSSGKKLLVIMLAVGSVLVCMPLGSLASQGPQPFDYWGSTGIMPINPLSEKPQPSPSTAWTITDAKSFSDMDGLGTDYAQDDSLTINSGGTVTADQNPTGDGSSGAIAVNAGGTLIVNPGITIIMNSGTALATNEGGKIFCMGTSGSHVILRGESASLSATHYIGCNAGGLFYTNYTDIDTISHVGMASGGWIEMHNSTITTCANCFRGVSYELRGLFINCSLTVTTASRYCIQPATDVEATFIDCTFSSTTNNYLATASYLCKCVFANCTYGGASIATDDFTATSTDYDIRIYDKSTVTDTNSVSGCSVSPSHPALDTMGLLFDSTNYVKVPGFLSFPQTNSSGMVGLYLLNKSAYWPSALAAGSRTWFYHSDGSQAETSTNAKWTVTCSKLGYDTDSDTQWAGTNFSVTMSPDVENVNTTVRTYDDIYCSNATSRYNYTDTVYVNGTITTLHDCDAWVNVTVMDWGTNDTVATLLPTTAWTFQTEVLVNCTELNSGTVLTWAPDGEGQYYVRLLAWNDTTGCEWWDNCTEDFLIQNFSSSTYYYNYTNNTWVNWTNNTYWLGGNCTNYTYGNTTYQNNTNITEITGVMIIYTNYTNYTYVNTTSIEYWNATGYTWENYTNVTWYNVTEVTTIPFGGIVYLFACFFEWKQEGFVVEFMDRSDSTIGVTRWDWDFGDGGEHSYEQNPRHRYLKPGTYNVTLRIVNSAHDTDNYTTQVDIVDSIMSMKWYIGLIGAVICSLIILAMVGASRKSEKKRLVAALTGLLVAAIVIIVLALQWTI